MSRTTLGKNGGIEFDENWREWVRRQEIALSWQISGERVTVNYVLDRFTWPGALPVYIGDDKDEVAFAAIKARHGLALVVVASAISNR